MLRYSFVKFYAFLSALLLCNLLQAQIGGTKSFRFLDVPQSARAAGNGGSTLPLAGDDINLLYSNPASLNAGMTKQVSFNYCNYVGDINYYNLAYAHQFKKIGTTALSLQAMNYGEFQGYDEIGNATKTFRARDYSFNLHYAKSIADSMFTVGLALKTILSQYENFQTMGNAVDFGILYHGKKDFTVGLTARNVGFMHQAYNLPTGTREALPNTVQVGVSKKVNKAPFRVFGVYDQLLRWNLNYVSPIDTAGQNSSFGKATAVDSSGFQKFSKRAGSFTDQFFRHTTIGTEILLSKNFNLRIAYNYRRQKEYTLSEKRGASALSFGFNMKIKSFEFAYAFTKMSVPANSHMLGLTLKW